MKLRVTIGAIFCLICFPLVVQAATNDAGSTRIFDRVRYNPAVAYNGSFGTTTIYYHNPRNPVWYVGLKIKLENISCRPAFTSLSTSGTWTGQLNQDGTCGGDNDPVVWGVGNWLNFNDAKGR